MPPPPRFGDMQRDNDRLKQRLDENDRGTARVAQEDVIIETPRRLFLRSPNGTFFQLTITDAGVVTAISIGKKLPSK